MKHQKVVCGVIIDETDLYNELESFKNESDHWQLMYTRQCEEYLKLMKENKELKNEIQIIRNKYNITDKPVIKCNKCLGNMEYSNHFKLYICKTCGNMESF
jgi:hypothetical protein